MGYLKINTDKAPRHLETRIKLAIRRLRDALRHQNGAPVYLYQSPSGSIVATTRENAIHGPLIGAYTEVDWRSVVADIEAL